MGQRGTGTLTERGERTRRRLLDLAIERFAAGGYRETSVSEIARAAGLTQAAVYAYFPNKEALFAEAANEDATALIIEARETIPEEMHVRYAIPTLLGNLVGSLDRHPLARRLLASDEPAWTGEPTSLPALDDSLDALRKGLTEAQRQGSLRADIDPEALAVGVQSAILSLLMAGVRVADAGISSADEQSALTLRGIAVLFDALFIEPAG